MLRVPVTDGAPGRWLLHVGWILPRARHLDSIVNASAREGEQ